MSGVHARQVLWAVLIVAAESVARIATAGPPSAFNSFVPPHLVTCPAGDSTFTVFARDPVNNAWGRCCVRLHLCSCSGIHLSTTGPHSYYTVDPTGCVVSVDLRDGTYSGIARFPLTAGGLCPGDSILVEGDGVLLAYVKRVASFDQTGDLKVDAGDLALVQSKIGTPDPTADFDGDGEVTAADLAIAEGHVGHTPSDAVGVPMPGIGTLALSRPIPNPFSGETHFILTLDRPAHVDVKVRDLAGRRVATIFRGALDAGSREFTWAGVSDEGAPVSSGAYFLQVRAGDQRLVGSEIVVKTQ